MRAPGIFALDRRNLCNFLVWVLIAQHLTTSEAHQRNCLERFDRCRKTRHHERRRKAAQQSDNANMAEVIAKSAEDTRARRQRAAAASPALSRNLVKSILQVRGVHRDCG